MVEEELNADPAQETEEGTTAPDAAGRGESSTQPQVQHLVGLVAAGGMKLDDAVSELRGPWKRPPNARGSISAVEIAWRDDVEELRGMLKAALALAAEGVQSTTESEKRSREMENLPDQLAIAFTVIGKIVDALGGQYPPVQIDKTGVVQCSADGVELIYQPPQEGALPESEESYPHISIKGKGSGDSQTLRVGEGGSLQLRQLQSLVRLFGEETGRGMVPRDASAGASGDPSSQVEAKQS